MQRSGDRQESPPVRASSDDQKKATQVVVDDLFRALKLAVGGVQPVQPEYVRTKKG